MAALVRVETEGSLCRITLIRPEVMNALNRSLRAGPTAALRGAFGAPLESQLALEARLLAACGATADLREGLAAFQEKRTPRLAGA